MSDVNSTSNNGIKAIALGVAIALHGLAGFGLAHMHMPELKPLKITPPLKVEMIEPVKEPEIQEVVVNNLESPEPPKPIAAPKVEKNPDPRPAPAKPKAAEPPKPVEPPKAVEPPKKVVEPPKKIAEPPKEIQKPKTEPPKKTEEPNRQAELLAAQQKAAAQAKWEAEQAAEAERRNREKAAADARAKAEADAKAKADADARAKAKAEADAKARADAAAAAKAKAAAEAAARASKGGSGQGDGKKSGEGRGTGHVIGEMNISAAQANASWKRKPNWSNIDAGTDKTKAVNFTVHLTIDEKGRITSATGVSTGLGSSVDRQIERAIRGAAFHPFKDSNGNPMRGKATLPMSFQVN